MTAATIFEALSDIARVFTLVYGSDNLDLPNTAFTPTPGTPWTKIRVQHTGMGQGSLSGDLGQKLWDRSGVGLIELRTPLGEGVQEAYDKAEALVTLYQNATTPTGVWFRNVQIIDDNSVDQSPPWYRIDVVFDFEYYQIN